MMATAPEPEAEWLDTVDLDELRALTTDKIVAEVGEIFKVRLEKGLVTNAETPPDQVEKPPPPKPSRFDPLWNEVFLFACTKNAKYRELRRTLKSKSTAVGVTVVATQIGAQFGMPVIGPTIAGMLWIVFSVSKNAACESLKGRYGQNAK